MERITVDEATVLQTLKDVVAERPDYVYEKPFDDNSAHDCLYVHPGTGDEPDRPGCLVGHVLHRLGVPLEELARHEGSGALSVTRLTTNASDRVRTTLYRAQCHQDSGESWADALRFALAAVPASAAV